MFSLTIKCDNAAFDAPIEYEIARILDELSRHIRAHGLPDFAAPLRDANGNTVGSYMFDREE